MIRSYTGYPLYFCYDVCVLFHIQGRLAYRSTFVKECVFYVICNDIGQTAVYFHDVFVFCDVQWHSADHGIFVMMCLCGVICSDTGQTIVD
jgi:hypothetical protein